MRRVSKNVPEIRFKEFYDEWISKKLGDMVYISSASRVRKDEWTSEGIPFFRSSDVISKYTKKYNTPAFITGTLYQKLSEKSGKMKAGDLLVTGGGTIGIPYLIENEDPLYFKDADLIWLKSSGVIDGNFLYNFYISPQTRRYISSITHIGTISHYTIEQGKDTPISLPVKSEQQKNGTFFKRLDDTIALQQQLVEQQQQYKKAMLQKMFPQNGERVPKIRFDEFSGEWKEKTIHEVVDGTIADGDWIEKEHIFEQGEYRIIQTGNLGLGEFIDKTNSAKFFHQKDFDELKANEIFANEILISRLAEPAGRTIILPETGSKMVTAVDVTIIRPNENFNSYFFVTLMNSERNLSKISPKVTGTSHKRISRKNLENILLSIPSIEEQRKVGSLFQKIDETITLQKQKMEHYKEMKKALLQRMFV